MVLIPNFLHHFDVPTCTSFLKKVRAALKPGGRAAILEFMPNDDRVTPPTAAAFSMIMLVNTPSGDAYTYAEIEEHGEECRLRARGAAKGNWIQPAGGCLRLRDHVGESRGLREQVVAFREATGSCRGRR